MITASHGGRARLDGGGDGRLVVAHEPEVDRLEPVLGEQGEQRAPVRLADLPRPERGAVGDQLVAGRQHADPRTAVGGHLEHADGGQHPEVPGGELLPRAEDDVADTHVVAGGTDVVAGSRRALDGHDGATVESLRALHHHDGVGTVGHRAHR